jgi:hypothetical protein
MTSASICLRVILLLAGTAPVLAQFTSAYDPTPRGSLNPPPLPPLPNPNAPNLAGEGVVRPQTDASSRAGTGRRLLCGRLHDRGGRFADLWADLAGNAGVA